jgi:hypothetical protein
MVVCDVGPAPILRDPVNPTIPHGYIPKSPPEYPCARADRRLNSEDGSELFIVDVWSMGTSSSGLTVMPARAFS